MPEQTHNTIGRLLADKKVFYDSLSRFEPEAIRLLSEKLAQSIKYLNGTYLLSPEDIDELRSDAILITLQKLTDGSFQHQDNSPVSYATAVARRLLANRLRKRRLETVELDGQGEQAGPDPEQYFLHKEAEMLLSEKLKELSGSCEQVIRLKYFDNLKDQEVVERGLSPYSTVDSLKNRRSQCLKKLGEMLRQSGNWYMDLLK